MNGEVEVEVLYVHIFACCQCARLPTLWLCVAVMVTHEGLVETSSTTPKASLSHYSW